MPGADLTAVKAQLRIDVATYDTQLQMYLNAVTAAVEAEVGPLEVRTFAETVSTRAQGFLLSNRPIQSIISVVPQLPTWPTFDGSDVTFDAEAGTVWRNDLGSLAGVWTVNYTAGNPVVSDDWRLAQLLLVQDLWETTRGGTRRPGMGGADPADALSNPYVMRRRVREVLGPSRHGGTGIA